MWGGGTWRISLEGASEAILLVFTRLWDIFQQIRTKGMILEDSFAVKTVLKSLKNT